MLTYIVGVSCRPILNKDQLLFLTQRQHKREIKHVDREKKKNNKKWIANAEGK